MPHGTKDERILDVLGAAWRFVCYAALAFVGVVVVWIAPRDSSPELVGKAIVIGAVALYLLPIISRPASRSFKETP